MEGNERNAEEQMPAHRRTGLGSVMIGAIVAAALVGAAWAVLRVDPSGRRGSGLSDRFDLDVERYTTVDPKLVAYEETGAFATGMAEVRAIVAGPDDRVYVAGDQAVRVFDLGGKPLEAIAVDGTPQCIAVGGPEHQFPGRIYVGLGDRVEAFDAGAEPVETWREGLGGKSVLTSIAVAEDDVFVADAGNRIVLRYDTRGKLIGRIGEPDPDRGIRGFFIPSPCFDVAVTPDGLLRVVNPAARRIEAYTFDGDLLGSWGKASAEIDGFFGCCNPAHFAVLEDGRFVTSEKGIPRIKVYSNRGQFECVVADPQTLAQGKVVVDETRAEHQLKALDVATTRQGWILALDPTHRTVRIFKPKG